MANLPGFESIYENANEAAMRSRAEIPCDYNAIHQREDLFTSARPQRPEDTSHSRAGIVGDGRPWLSKSTTNPDQLGFGGGFAPGGAYEHFGNVVTAMDLHDPESGLRNFSERDLLGAEQRAASETAARRNALPKFSANETGDGFIVDAANSESAFSLNVAGDMEEGRRLVHTSVDDDSIVYSLRLPI